MSEYGARVARELVRVREARGISQAFIATKLGVGQSVVSRMEAGTIVITVDRLRQWARLLDTSAVAILSAAERRKA